MKKIIILTIILLSGCSANRVQLQPQLINKQTVSYVRGHSKISSESPLKSEFSVLEYSSDEMVISLSVTNESQQSIIFSEQNVKAEHLSSGDLAPSIVYNYNELIQQATDKGYQNVAKVGNTAASIGARFVPFGGIALSIGRLFYSIGSSNTETDEDRVDKATFSQLHKNYIRQQTIDPLKKYSGILKIGFADELESGDSLIFTLYGEGDSEERFIFDCR